MRVCLVSLGCPKNLVDGETILGQLGLAGHEIAATPDLADVVIVNTCGFIRDAQRESIDTILEMARKKSEGRLLRVLATGCLAQRSGAELLAEIPELDGAVGTGGIGAIADVLAAVAAGERVLSSGPPGFLPEGVAPRLLVTRPWTAYLKISEGCDNRCAYCVIPDLRGPHRSRPAAHIRTELEQLVAAGVREVTLVGQDLTRWGGDLPGRPVLADLLEQLDIAQGPRWLRLHYLHPARVDDRLLETIARLKSVCNYLDLPMQHGSSRILAAMRRGTTPDDLLRLAGRARETIPGVAIRTSFIAGFPGETEADFEQLLRLMRRVSADWAGVFSYSREEGTPAAEMPDQVPARLKIRRRALAMALQRRVSRRQASRLLGQHLPVLVETPRQEVRLPDGMPAMAVGGRSYREAPDVDGQVWLRIAPGNEAPEAGSFVTARPFANGPYDIFADIVPDGDAGFGPSHFSQKSSPAPQ